MFFYARGFAVLRARQSELVGGCSLELLALCYVTVSSCRSCRRTKRRDSETKGAREAGWGGRASEREEGEVSCSFLTVTKSHGKPQTSTVLLCQHFPNMFPLVPSENTDICFLTICFHIDLKGLCLSVVKEPIFDGQIKKAHSEPQLKNIYCATNMKKVDMNGFCRSRCSSLLGFGR